MLRRSTEFIDPHKNDDHEDNNNNKNINNSNNLPQNTTSTKKI